MLYNFYKYNNSNLQTLRLYFGQHLLRFFLGTPVVFGSAGTKHKTIRIVCNGNMSYPRFTRLKPVLGTCLPEYSKIGQFQKERPSLIILLLIVVNLPDQILIVVEKVGSNIFRFEQAPKCVIGRGLHQVFV